MEITKENINQVINALIQCAKEHESDVTSTFNIKVSDLCNDVANYLKNIQKSSIIQIPTNDEIINASIDTIKCYCEDGDPRQYVDCDLCVVPCKREAFIKGVNWLNVRLRNIKNVILTDEILEKNGFVKGYNRWDKEETVDDTFYPYEIHLEDEGHFLYVEIKTYDAFYQGKICNVYELQNVLYICGLNKLADNFII